MPPFPNEDPLHDIQTPDAWDPIPSHYMNFQNVCSNTSGTATTNTAFQPQRQLGHFRERSTLHGDWSEQSFERTTDLDHCDFGSCLNEGEEETNSEFDNSGTPVVEWSEALLSLSAFRNYEQTQRNSDQRTHDAVYLSAPETSISNNRHQDRASGNIGSPEHLALLSNRLDTLQTELEALERAWAEQDRWWQASLASAAQQLAEADAMRRQISGRSSATHSVTDISTNTHVENPTHIVVRSDAQVQARTREAIARTIRALLTPWAIQARMVAVYDYLRRAGIIGRFELYDEIGYSELGCAISKYGLSFLFGWVCGFKDGMLKIDSLARKIGRKFAANFVRCY